MIIMGIDSSTTSTGWAIIDTRYDDELRLLAHEKITPNKKMDSEFRRIYIVDELKERINYWKPEFIVIEEVNVFRNAKTARALIGLLASIIDMLNRKNILHKEFTPTEWRKLVGIKGKNRVELKQASVEFVWNKYFETVNNDEADAICIAEAGSFIKVEE